MTEPVPDAELLIATGCSHCPIVLAALADMIKAGQLASLSVSNISVAPDAATQRNVRSVPWIRIGPFELTGTYSRSELSAYAERANSESGRREYLLEALAEGQIDAVTAVARRHPEMLATLLTLTGDLDAPFVARIGANAVAEDPAVQGKLAEHAGLLLQLAANDNAQVRADAAHLLGLAGTASCRQRLRALLEDPDDEVRQIARESLGMPGDDNTA